MWLINLLNGEILNEYMLEVWIKGNLGLSVELEDEDLEEVENILIVCKMFDILKVVLMEEKQMELVLCVSEVVLVFDFDDLYEICDCGLIYV